jgi:hypothetical protein
MRGIHDLPSARERMDAPDEPGHDAPIKKAGAPDGQHLAYSEFRNCTAPPGAVNGNNA